MIPITAPPGTLAKWIGGLALATVLAGCDDGAPEPAAQEADPAPALSSGATGGGAASKQAELRIKIEPVGYLFTDGRHRFTQNRRFTESAGVGVTLTRGRVCVDQGQECVEANVTYRINAGKELLQPNHYIATLNVPDRAMVQYWGSDDNGNPVTVRTEMDLILPAQGLNPN